MDKETTLTLLSALRIEIIVLVVFVFGLRFGLRKVIPQKWLARILIGLIAITFTTFLVFTYTAYASNGQHT
ncbi:MAG TPA: hypothetical protein PL023_02240 [Thiobacillus sp.]|nr:hypothetical protein [Thiobacillus sp.]